MITDAVGYHATYHHTIYRGCFLKKHHAYNILQEGYKQAGRYTIGASPYKF